MGKPGQRAAVIFWVPQGMSSQSAARPRGPRPHPPVLCPAAGGANLGLQVAQTRSNTAHRPQHLGFHSYCTLLPLPFSLMVFRAKFSWGFLVCVLHIWKSACKQRWALRDKSRSICKSHRHLWRAPARMLPCVLQMPIALESSRE